MERASKRMPFLCERNAMSAASTPNQEKEEDRAQRNGTHVAACGRM